MTIYDVIEPSFDEVPMIEEERAKELIIKIEQDFVQQHPGYSLNITLQEFREDFYEKDGKVQMRHRYQSNKPPGWKYPS